MRSLSERKQEYAKQVMDLITQFERSAQNSICGNPEYVKASKDLLATLFQILKKDQNKDKKQSQPIYKATKIILKSFKPIITPIQISTLKSEVCPPMYSADLPEQSDEAIELNFSDILHIVFKILLEFARLPTASIALNSHDIKHTQSILPEFFKKIYSLQKICDDLILNALKQDTELLEQFNSFLTKTHELCLASTNLAIAKHRHSLLITAKLSSVMADLIKPQSKTHFVIIINQKQFPAFGPHYFCRHILALGSLLTSAIPFKEDLQLIITTASALAKEHPSYPVFEICLESKKQIEKISPYIKSIEWGIEPILIENESVMYVLRMKKALEIKNEKNEKWCLNFKKKVKKKLDIDIEYFKRERSNIWYPQIILFSTSLKCYPQFTLCSAPIPIMSIESPSRSLAKKKREYTKQAMDLITKFERSAQNSICGNPEYVKASKDLLATLFQILKKDKDNELKPIDGAINLIQQMFNPIIPSIQSPICREEVYPPMYSADLPGQSNNLIKLNFSDALYLLFNLLIDFAKGLTNHDRLDSHDIEYTQSISLELVKEIGSLRKICDDLILNALKQDIELFKQLTSFLTKTHELCLASTNLATAKYRYSLLIIAKLSSVITDLIRPQSKTHFGIIINQKEISAFGPHYFCKYILALGSLLTSAIPFKEDLQLIITTTSALAKDHPSYPVFEYGFELKKQMGLILPNIKSIEWGIEPVVIIDDERITYVLRMKKAFKIESEKDKKWCSDFRERVKNKFHIDIEYFKRERSSYKWHPQITMFSIPLKSHPQFTLLSAPIPIMAIESPSRSLAKKKQYAKQGMDLLTRFERSAQNRICGNPKYVKESNDMLTNLFQMIEIAESENELKLIGEIMNMIKRFENKLDIHLGDVKRERSYKWHPQITMFSTPPIEPLSESTTSSTTSTTASTSHCH